MGKKQFVELADAIIGHNSWATEDEKFTDEHITTLAAFCKRQNPRFDPHLWTAYIAGEVGPNGGART